MTNFVTVDPAAQQMFGEIYRVGRQGDMEKIVRLCKQAASQKEIWLTELQSGARRLDDAIYKSIWIEADKPVRPVPWDSEHSTRLKINVNAATDVDFFALDGLTFPQCQELVRIREQYGGFPVWTSSVKPSHRSSAVGRAKIDKPITEPHGRSNPQRKSCAAIIKE